MDSTYRTHDWIGRELARLGCPTISVSMPAGFGEAFFTRGGEVVKLDLRRIQAAFSLLDASVGEDAVWTVLQILARRGLRRPA